MCACARACAQCSETDYSPPPVRTRCSGPLSDWIRWETVLLLLLVVGARLTRLSSEGKTLSYAIPVVQSLQAVQPKVSRGDGPLALIVVPTREVLSGAGSALGCCSQPLSHWSLSFSAGPADVRHLPEASEGESD